MYAKQTTRNGDKLNKATSVGLGGCFAVQTSIQWWRNNWWQLCPPAAPFASLEVSET